MRNYYIVETDLGFKVCREKKEGWVKEWRQGNTYTLNKEFAKTYYHMNEAASGLVLAKIKWKKETPTTSTRKSESEGGKEKRSW